MTARLEVLVGAALQDSVRGEVSERALCPVLADALCLQ